MSDLPWDMPPSTRKAFEPIRGAWVIRRMLADERLGLSKVIHPGAIVGNLAGESRLQTINELVPLVPGSRGGFGWAQWTGMGEGGRRAAFEAFTAEHGWQLTDEIAHYEFLVFELLGPEKRSLAQLKKTTTLEAATYTFEKLFERPASLDDVDERVQYAQQAIDAMGLLPPLAPEEPSPEQPAPSPPPAPAVARGEAATPDVLDAAVRLMQTVLDVAGYYSGPIDGVPNQEMVSALMAYRAWLLEAKS